MDEEKAEKAQTAKKTLAGREPAARRMIAYLLIGLLGLVVSGMLILLGFGIIDVDHIKELGVILSPIIALVSAATGFYYGTKSNFTNGK
ncbi:MAG: hypothetical protein IT525_00665 [Nitrosomonas sp.]|jgi:hypothetical protein|nr:hypothetical protein [Nitrosomonas sp.]